MDPQSEKQSSGQINWLLGGLLIFMGALFLLGNVFRVTFVEALIPIIILSGIGFTFFAVYLNNRQHWWALIPAYVMFSVAGIIALSSVGLAHIVAPYIMFAIAFPFLYVYLRNRENWWALIPAGIMGSIGIALLAGFAMGFFVSAIPALMIIIGIYLLVRNLGGRGSETALQEADLPKTGPEADRTF
jgi:hypothetical protein